MPGLWDVRDSLSDGRNHRGPGTPGGSPRAVYWLRLVRDDVPVGGHEPSQERTQTAAAEGHRSIVLANIQREVRAATCGGGRRGPFGGAEVLTNCSVWQRLKPNPSQSSGLPQAGRLRCSSAGLVPCFSTLLQLEAESRAASCRTPKLVVSPASGMCAYWSSHQTDPQRGESRGLRKAFRLFSADPAPAGSASILLSQRSPPC
jgi:hypothetical protein